MPEGPELHLASLFVNRVCGGVVFTGPVQRSEVSKNPEVSFSCPAYTITATSRGKEVCLTLTPKKSDSALGRCRRVKAGQANQGQNMDIFFRFGMSGFFRFTTEATLPKHAHLRFYTNEKPCRVLSFVDARRFGSWQPNGTWQPNRGPCIMFEYQSYRENVLSHLSDRAFDRPICEVLLNQKYFNGIGNYLRAEILFRLNIPPFVKARTVLEGLQTHLSEEDQKSAVKVETTDTEVKEEVTDTEVKEEVTDTEVSDRAAVKVVKVESETPDLLSLCHTVPLEVIKLGGKGYDPENKDYSAFKSWLQCYYVDGMRSIRDHNGRTVWFKGDPGPMAPKDSKSPKAKMTVKKEDDHDYTGKKKVKKACDESAVKPKDGKKETVKKETVQKKVTKEKEVPQRRAGRRKSAQEVKANTPQQKKRTAAAGPRRKTTRTETSAAAPQTPSGRGTRNSARQ
ncbi:endonuclease 8-like 1 isoform X1 [Coregonus clupeaformis]|uniref:endonuclease 8-like 1 isoform X1 n=1 Tax=Coregonus clupeaformis TaxID=59861 RepID=UPI001E1C3EA3|nr:endonuclease 8-like 1 isoform X1 [Coregonus clupeaformis]